MDKDKLDARFRKKISQLIMLMEREKASGKIDWHSRNHLASDAARAAFAGEHGASTYEKPNPK